jgi:hypothetical protein
MTLADLKRMANSNTKKAVVTYRYGKDIPERLQGVRPIVRANSVAIFFQNADGRESELRIDSAKLVEYDGKHITLYEAGERELTDDEKEIKRQEQAYLDEKYKENPYNSGYWAKNVFTTSTKNICILQAGTP